MRKLWFYWIFYSQKKIAAVKIAPEIIFLLALDIVVKLCDISETSNKLVWVVDGAVKFVMELCVIDALIVELFVVERLRFWGWAQVGPVHWGRQTHAPFWKSPLLSQLIMGICHTFTAVSVHTTRLSDFTPVSKSKAVFPLWESWEGQKTRDGGVSNVTTAT